jgi:hypothetical protein
MDPKAISDGYVSRTGCPKCKESRSVTCSREDVKGDGAVKVWAIECDHSWTLSAKEKLRLREELGLTQGQPRAS